MSALFSSFALSLATSVPLDAFRQSDIVGKIIVVILALISMYTWGVMAGKWTDLAGMSHFTRLFLKFYRGTSHPAMAHLGERKLVPGSPLVVIYADATKELLSALRRVGVGEEELRAWRPGETGFRLSDVEIAAIRGMAQRRLAEQQLAVEHKMSRIATATTSAPSIGLFGTVWGVMVAFMAMGSGGANMISSVAPGISGALLTTVVGLLVAIPSAIGYNALSDRVRELVVEMENFVDEFMADVSRIHGAGGGK